MQMTLHSQTDVPVVPVTAVHQHVAEGGPIWADFDRQTSLRHCRNGLPVDRRPHLAAEPQRRMGSAVWGGFLDRHFGHYMAEHFPRLPVALQNRPDDPYLFSVDPGVQRQDIPDWTWALLAWAGLGADRVQVVTDPVRVARLHAAPQAEMLPQNAPAPAYLDLLADLAQARNLTPIPADLVYVTRAGLPQVGGGGTAGEGHLVDCLTRLGVPVLDPGQSDLGHQMATYAGARHLVFAEGSALHGRQLLGRLPQRITVLRRRRGRAMARAMLTPRVEALTYREATATALVPHWRNGTPRPDPALSFYDLPALTAAFAALGVDLTTVWQPDGFRAALSRDLAGWIAHHRPPPPLHAAFRTSLAAIGLADLLPPAALSPLSPA